VIAEDLSYVFGFVFLEPFFSFPAFYARFNGYGDWGFAFCASWVVTETLKSPRLWVVAFA